ncbi:MAG: MerR family transcriptional regulator [Chloroflexi bacterium]|nr:MerR family transcriptional regulator [Chloroflexota bacterium]
MFKIGEFSQMAQVSVRMLRHYDKLGLLKPSSVDHFTGYRYYTLDQLPRLNRILAMQDLGLSLRQIGDLLRQDLPVEQLKGMLALKQAELSQQIEDEQRRLARVQARLRMIEQEAESSLYEVVLKETEPLTAATIRQIVPTIQDMQAYRCSMLDDVYGWLQKHHIQPNGHETIIYHMTEYIEENLDMEIAIPVADEVYEELASRSRGDLTFRRLDDEGDFACTVHSGQIWDIPQAIISLVTWIKTNGYDIMGGIREVHLSGRETSITDFDNIVFEFQIPVQPFGT